MSEKSDFARLWDRTLAFQPPISMKGRHKVSTRRCVQHVRGVWGKTKYFASYRYAPPEHRFFVWRPTYKDGAHDGYQALVWRLHEDNPLPTPWHIPFFLSQHSIDRVMQRCNCNSAAALDELRLLPVSVLGVVNENTPPCKLYLRTPHGALFATARHDSEGRLSVRATTWLSNYNLSFEQHQMIQEHPVTMEVTLDET